MVDINCEQERKIHNSRPRQEVGGLSFCEGKITQVQTQAGQVWKYIHP